MDDKRQTPDTYSSTSARIDLNQPIRQYGTHEACRTRGSAPAHASLPGGYSVGVPPDPIPNSAVKPDSADGTIAQAMEE